MSTAAAIANAARTLIIAVAAIWGPPATAQTTPKLKVLPFDPASGDGTTIDADPSEQSFPIAALAADQRALDERHAQALLG